MLAGTGNITVREMKDSSHLIDDFEELRRVFSDEGYLLLRNYLDKRKVQKARKSIVNTLKAEGYLKDGSKVCFTCAIRCEDLL